jgi:acyl carrier protein
MNRLFALQEIFRQIFDDNDTPITLETSPEKIDGWDSVAQVKLILAMEEEFAIQFSEDEVSSIHTVGDFLHAIETHKARVS